MNQHNDFIAINSPQFIKVTPHTDNPFNWSERIFANLDVLENTRREYNTRIQSFLSFIRENGFTKNSYLEYKRHLSQRTDFSISTKNKYLIVARVYCKELHREEYLPIDITLNIKSFQQTRKHKKNGLTEVEIQKILIYTFRKLIFGTI